MTQQEIADAVIECERKYGDAHRAHMEVNDECPWCGLTRDQHESVPIEVMLRAQLAR